MRLPAALLLVLPLPAALCWRPVDLFDMVNSDEQKQAIGRECDCIGERIFGRWYADILADTRQQMQAEERAKREEEQLGRQKQLARERDEAEQERRKQDDEARAAAAAKEKKKKPGNRFRKLFGKEPKVNNHKEKRTGGDGIIDGVAPAFRPRYRELVAAARHCEARSLMRWAQALRGLSDDEESATYLVEAAGDWARHVPAAGDLLHTAHRRSLASGMETVRRLMKARGCFGDDSGDAAGGQKGLVGSADGRDRAVRREHQIIKDLAEPPGDRREQRNAIFFEMHSLSGVAALLGEDERRSADAELPGIKRRICAARRIDCLTPKPDPWET